MHYLICRLRSEVLNLDYEPLKTVKVMVIGRIFLEE